jgi:hypothetical protein
MEILEKVQRRDTKLVPNLKFLAFKDILIAMNLNTLVTRRNRDDLIQLYKLEHGFD